MKTLLAASFAALLVGCRTTQHLAYSGGDGSSSQQAVVINDITYRETAKLAERIWLGRKFPGYCEVTQSAMNDGNRHFDLIELTTAGGQKTKVYFDSTQFFAK